MRNQLSSLRVVRLDQITCHERFDPERAADLALRLTRDHTLINPVIVVEWREHYIVLDGATRVAAFMQLGYPHIVVQIISADDTSLGLGVWNHAISDPQTDTLMTRMLGLSCCRLTPSSQYALQSALESAEALCGIVTNDGQHYLVQPSASVDNLTALNAIVAAYSETCSIHRMAITDLVSVRTRVPNLSALVLFPQIDLSAVLQAAAGGEPMPAGITRFIVPGRVLRLHADLARLYADEPLEHKNSWLEDLLVEKQAKRSVRYYQEPVILLDE